MELKEKSLVRGNVKSYSENVFHLFQSGIFINDQILFMKQIHSNEEVFWRSLVKARSSNLENYSLPKYIYIYLLLFENKSCCCCFSWRTTCDNFFRCHNMTFFFSNLKWNPKTKRIWPPVIFILVHKNLLPNIPCQCEVSFESKKDAAMLLFHLFLWWYNINKQWLVHCYKYFREMPLWN